MIIKIILSLIIICFFSVVICRGSENVKVIYISAATFGFSIIFIFILLLVLIWL